MDFIILFLLIILIFLLVLILMFLYKSKNKLDEKLENYRFEMEDELTKIINNYDILFEQNLKKLDLLINKYNKISSKQESIKIKSTSVEDKKKILYSQNEEENLKIKKILQLINSGNSPESVAKIMGIGTGEVNLYVNFYNDK
ncbi:hypothetical protein OF820_13450 [Oceanotoga sp. DSM 15011]|uniref:DUF6115 domain-containing protein n=1 Tax=Oceanotoga sp. DSM 15011 TaxID=2984951 RepID=UPI0021F439B8|nr:hypothetical protein [Oceanotoga sp. DSM 15011]UYP00036.1 hypothetical protein OF820_13450 [Oceanotoga sp. DSM 15011]